MDGDATQLPPGLEKMIERRAKLDERTQKEIDDIYTIVSRLDQTKQDRIPVAVWVTILIWAFGVTWYGATTLAGIQKTQEQLVYAITEMNENEYHVKDAEKDQLLQQQRDAQQDEKIAENRAELFRFRKLLEKRLENHHE